MENTKIKNQKMSDTFEVSGIWSKSIDGISKGVSGILKYSPENITLELMGKINVDLNDLECLDREENSFDGCIYGFTVNGEYVTLYDCFCFKSSNNFPGIKTESYVVNSLLVGGLHKKEEIAFKNSYVYFSNLAEWLGKGIVTHNMDSNMKHTYEIDRDKIKTNLANINIPSIGLTIQEGYTITHKSHTDRIDVTSERYFKFITDDVVELKSQLDNIQKIKKLIGFLINESIHTEKIEIVASEMKDYKGKSYDERDRFLYFVKQTINKKVLKWHEQLFTYNDISENLEQIFNRWIEGYENIGECYDLINTNLHTNKYDENIFLDCARAMEVFHRNVFGDLFKPAKDEEIEKYCEELIKYINTNVKEDYRDHFLDRILYESEPTFAKKIIHIFEILDDTIPYS